MPFFEISLEYAPALVYDDWSRAPEEAQTLHEYVDRLRLVKPHLAQALASRLLDPIQRARLLPNYTWTAEDDFACRLDLANSQISQRNFVGALATLDAITVHPKAISLQEAQARVHNGLAENAADESERKKFEATRDEIVEAMVEAEARLGIPEGTRASVLFGMGRVDDAMVVLRQAVNAERLDKSDIRYMLSLPSSANVWASDRRVEIWSDPIWDQMRAALGGVQLLRRGSPVPEHPAELPMDLATIRASFETPAMSDRVPLSNPALAEFIRSK